MWFPDRNHALFCVSDPPFGRRLIPLYTATLNQPPHFTRTHICTPTSGGNSVFHSDGRDRRPSRRAVQLYQHQAHPLANVLLCQALAALPRSLPRLVRLFVSRVCLCRECVCVSLCVFLVFVGLVDCDRLLSCLVAIHVRCNALCSISVRSTHQRPFPLFPHFPLSRFLPCLEC